MRCSLLLNVTPCWRHVSTRHPRPRPERASVGQRRSTTGPLWHPCEPTELARDAHSGRGRGCLVLTCLQPFCLILVHSSSVARVAAYSPVLLQSSNFAQCLAPRQPAVIGTTSVVPQHVVAHIPDGDAAFRMGKSQSAACTRMAEGAGTKHR